MNLDRKNSLHPVGDPDAGRMECVMQVRLYHGTAGSRRTASGGSLRRIKVPREAEDTAG